MSKPKVLFIGNYKETRTRELLDAFVKKYENVFDIFASGYYYGNIEETTIGKDARGSLSSSKYFYYRDTAEYAIITTLAPLYEKRKANQKLIYVTSECLMDTIEGCIGDVDAVITDNQAVWEDIQSRFDHLRVQMTDLDNAEEVIGAMSIAEDLPKDTEDYLVVTANAGGGLFMNEDGLHHVFGEIRNDAGNNIIVCSLNGADKMSTSAIPMDGSFISTCILNEFDGTVLFDTEYIRSYFLEFTGNNGIKLKAKEMKMLHDMKLKGLEKAAAAGEEASHAKNTGEYVQYRIFMDRLYEINNCSESMVSVIICRYNTPWDLMKRSIQSALNTGHDNVEVVIVDDGSEDNIEKTIFEEFHDVRVKYYYKDNEGPGPSRDYGVMRATGEYVFYLSERGSSAMKMGNPAMNR